MTFNVNINQQFTHISFFVGDLADSLLGKYIFVIFPTTGLGVY